MEFNDSDDEQVNIEYNSIRQSMTDFYDLKKDELFQSIEYSLDACISDDKETYACRDLGSSQKPHNLFNRCTFNYNITDYLRTENINEYIESNNLQLVDIEVNVCAYQVNTSETVPFLQYILQKTNGLDPMQPEKLQFHSFQYPQGSNTFDPMLQCEDMLAVMYVCYSKNGMGKCNYIYKGFAHDILSDPNNIYIFYDVSDYRIESHKLSRKNDLWLVLMDEMVNKRSSCNFTIDYNVSNFFLTHPEFIFLMDEFNNHIELPIVGYSAHIDKQLELSLIFGKSKEMRDDTTIPNYYFTDYTSALEQSREMLNNIDPPEKKILTVNRIFTGKSSTGESGIVRYALFMERGGDETINNDNTQDIRVNHYEQHVPLSSHITSRRNITPTTSSYIY